MKRPELKMKKRRQNKTVPLPRLSRPVTAKPAPRRRKATGCLSFFAKLLNPNDTGIDVEAIGRPYKKLPKSQLHPESGLEQEVDTARHLTTYMLIQVGTSSFDGTNSFAGKPLMLESPESQVPSMNEENSRSASSSVPKKYKKVSEFQHHLLTTSKDISKSPEKDIKAGLQRFSMSTVGENPSLRIASSERESYLGTFDDNENEALEPMVRRPGVSSFKKRKSKKRNDKLGLPSKFRTSVSKEKKDKKVENMKINKSKVMNKFVLQKNTSWKRFSKEIDNNILKKDKERERSAKVPGQYIFSL